MSPIASRTCRTSRAPAAAHHDYQRGVRPTGAGARDLIAAFTAADQTLVRHDPGPATVIDDRRVERVLKTALTAKAETLHVGVGNYCWFAEPGKALCCTRLTTRFPELAHTNHLGETQPDGVPVVSAQ